MKSKMNKFWVQETWRLREQVVESMQTKLQNMASVPVKAYQVISSNILGVTQVLGSEREHCVTTSPHKRSSGSIGIMKLQSPQ